VGSNLGHTDTLGFCALEREFHILLARCLPGAAESPPPCEGYRSFSPTSVTDPLQHASGAGENGGRAGRNAETILVRSLTESLSVLVSPSLRNRGSVDHSRCRTRGHPHHQSDWRIACPGLQDVSASTAHQSAARPTASLGPSTLRHARFVGRDCRRVGVGSGPRHFQTGPSSEIQRKLAGSVSVTDTAVPSVGLPPMLLTIMV
jgi:hypothetical protein